jgi:hypothetical protein
VRRFPGPLDGQKGFFGFGFGFWFCFSPASPGCLWKEPTAPPRWGTVTPALLPSFTITHP